MSYYLYKMNKRDFGYFSNAAKQLDPLKGTGNKHVHISLAVYSQMLH